MIKNPETKMEKMQESINKDLEELKNKHVKKNNTITEIKNTRRKPTRLPHPWDSPGKNTGLGCHFLLQCMKVKSEGEVAQSCPTRSDPMDCSLPGSLVHGIFQARVLEWGAIAFSEIHTTLYEIEKQQGPTVWHRELYSTACNNLYWKRI